MSFVQIEFVGFMTIVLAAYWLVGRHREGRTLQNLLLVVASALFYGWIHPWFLILLYGSATVDFWVGRAMVRRPEHRTGLLMVSLAVNLGVLAYFKYLNFFVQNVIDLLGVLQIHTDLRTLAIVLPVGVSFYTFQTLSYTIDVYRGELEPRSRFLDYVVFVTFFPQLVAGPIERAARLLPQVETPRVFDAQRTIEGLTLALWGAFKKLAVADTLAPYIDKVFVLESPPGPLIWAASAAFTVQIFADFSGYTDMARGLARMLGFELSENFRSPFLAATTPEFWQRWHITLSFWIRDYLMVPLLGSASRLGQGRFSGAVLVTFVAIGFWHGASWNFVLFGAFHGVWMVIYTWIGRLGGSPPSLRPLWIVVHFVAVSVPGSLLFRETHLDRIGQHLSQIPWAASLDAWIATSVVVGMTLLCATPLVISHGVVRWVAPRIRPTVWSLPAQTTLWAVLGLGIFVFYRVNTFDFIYFQF